LKNSLGRGNLSPLVEDCSFFITVAVLESYKIFKGYFHKTLAQLSFNTATEKSVYTIIWRLPTGTGGQTRLPFLTLYFM
jgi:hypothetical protein